MESRVYRYPSSKWASTRPFAPAFTGLSIAFFTVCFLPLPILLKLAGGFAGVVCILFAFAGFAASKAIEYEVGSDYIAMKSGNHEQRWTIEEIDLACFSPASRDEAAMVVLFDKSVKPLLFAHDQLIGFEEFREQIKFLTGDRFLVEDAKAIWERQKGKRSAYT